jgi:hypothetical protein
MQGDVRCRPYCWCMVLTCLWLSAPGVQKGLKEVAGVLHAEDDQGGDEPDHTRQQQGTGAAPGDAAAGPSGAEEGGAGSGQGSGSQEGGSSRAGLRRDSLARNSSKR